MTFRATPVASDPLDYFLYHRDTLHVTDVVLRENKNPKEIFAAAIRLATGSKWSHSAIVYLVSDPPKGFHNAFLIEDTTKGTHLTSWRNEVVPYKQFTVGIKRPRLEWYVETPFERARHDPCDPEDRHGIDYLRHVRGIALDQLNGRYDRKTVFELAALYAKRIAQRRLSGTPQLADAADAVAKFMKRWDEQGEKPGSALRFICSGLVQYSFLEALRVRIAHDLSIPEHREAALSNLSNLQRIIFCPDPEGLITHYLKQVQAGMLDIADPVHEDIMDLLKTATPADFNNSEHLQWSYVIRQGVVWKIDVAPADYQPQSQDEADIIAMLAKEHFSS